MLPIELPVTDSNSAVFPAGGHVGGYTYDGRLVEFAGYEIEEIHYSSTRHYVHIATALGYHFTVAIADYQQLATE
jgi:hypothetical protein